MSEKPERVRLQRSRPGELLFHDPMTLPLEFIRPVLSFRYVFSCGTFHFLGNSSSLQPIAARSKDSLFRTALVSLTAPIKLHSSPSKTVKLKTGGVVEAWNGGLFVWPCPKVAWNSFTSHVSLCALGDELQSSDHQKVKGLAVQFWMLLRSCLSLVRY